MRTTDEYRKKIALTQIGDNNSSRKLYSEEVIEIRRLYNEMLASGHKKTQSQYFLASKYGVKRPTISDIVLRKTWTHLN